MIYLYIYSGLQTCWWFRASFCTHTPPFNLWLYRC